MRKGKKIFLGKQIHSCFATVSSNDIFLYKEVKDAPRVNSDISDILELPSFLIIYVAEDKTFYERGLKERGLKDYNNTPEFQELVNSHITDGWLRELPPEVERERREKWRQEDEEWEQERKKKGCILVGKKKYLPEDYKGGLSDEVFSDNYLQSYVQGKGVFGYIGHLGRTYKTDKYLEQEFLKIKVAIDVNKRHLLAIWLTSSHGRHFCDSLEGLTVAQQKSLIDKEVKGLFLNAYVYSLSEHKGTYDSTESLREVWKNKLFFKGKRMIRPVLAKRKGRM